MYIPRPIRVNKSKLKIKILTFSGNQGHRKDSRKVPRAHGYQ